MDREYWQQVEKIIDVALTLDEPEQSTYVEETCAGQEKLLKEVKQILQSIKASDDHQFLEIEDEADQLFMHEFRQEFDKAEQQFLLGKEIGPWRIMERIGSGGMGTVFKAERVDGAFHQTVAVKLMRFGAGSKEHLYRFKLEREILARLNHPNIASIYDGGVTEEGLPYLVMQHVDGKPIDEWCDQKRCSIEERIKLFQNVCRAVEYAHNNLIVHRDLKPQNIYVTEEGDVKILDFGIAKLLDISRYEESLPDTRTGQWLGTPHYMAPEQIQGDPVTIASDIYSLGVLLHQLLCGTFPFDFSGKKIFETEQMIVTQDPVPPSRSASFENAHNRQFQTAGQLKKYLSGDLDTIVLQTLKKAPGERYGSTGQLLEDLHRYESALPLLAHKEALKYRLSKFVKRNRTMLAAVSIILLTVGIMTTYHIFKLTEQRNISQLEAAKARAAQDYLIELFEAADPTENQGEQVTVQQIVQRGIDRLEENFADEPEVHVEMLKVLGQVEQALGDFDLSAELLEKALIKTREIRGEEHLDVATVAAMLGNVSRWGGELDKAESLLREALMIRRRFIQGDNTEIAINMDRLARTLEMQGEHEEAETLYRQALEMRERLFGNNSEAVSSNLNNLGWLYYEMGKLDEATEALKRSLAIKEQLLEPPQVSIASTMSNLAVVLQTKGEYQEAEHYAEQALDQERRIHGDDHPRVATAMSNRSLILLELAKYKEAAEQYRQILEKNRKQLGPDHLYVGMSLGLLSYALIEDGRSGEALPLLEESLNIFRKAVGEEHRYYAITLMRRGDALFWHNPNQAVTVLEESVEILRRVVDPDHPNLAEALTQLGRARFATGDVEAAETTLREAIDIQRLSLPASHTETIWTLIHLGRVLMEMDHSKEAESLLYEAVKAASEALPSGHWRGIAARLDLAACQMANGQLTTVRGEIEQILTELQGRTDFHAVWLQARARELQNQIRG